MDTTSNLIPDELSDNQQDIHNKPDGYMLLNDLESDPSKRWKHVLATDYIKGLSFEEQKGVFIISKSLSVTIYELKHDRIKH